MYMAPTVLLTLGNRVATVYSEKQAAFIHTDP